MKPIVIVGIHTGVGKTVVSTIITEALRGYYWKPIQCGNPRDRDWVNEHLFLKNRCYLEHFYLKTPCSVHLASKAEGVFISAKDLVPPVCHGTLIIEGTGGLLSPLNETESWADAAIQWDANWILVHHHYLGSLNHFFLTLEAIKQRQLPLRGIIFNGSGDDETEKMLLKKAQTNCLGKLEWQSQITKTVIQKIANQWKATIKSIL